jgi:hypothetical protein
VDAVGHRTKRVKSSESGQANLEDETRRGIPVSGLTTENVKRADEIIRQFRRVTYGRRDCSPKSVKKMETRLSDN